MSNEVTPTLPASIDLWKFFEDKAEQQKETTFKLVTWIVGFAGVLLGFTVTQGFEKGFEKIAHPIMVLVFGLVGFGFALITLLIVRDHGRHIRRTERRACAAQQGKSDPQDMKEADNDAKRDPLPWICCQLLAVIAVFGLAFLGLALFASYALVCHLRGLPDSDCRIVTVLSCLG
jgi:hypothetical protein